ncbi:MAG: EpsI family protein [Verrucomicrobiales bacterium]|nr:EpsI family protein [Verrucomicrobiales bacterium]
MNTKIWKLIAPVVLFATALLVCWLSPNPNTTPVAGVKMVLPDQVGDMTGGELQGMSDAEKRLLPGDTEMTRRVYGNARGEMLACTIVLAGGAKNSIHRPEACLPAQGWNIDSEEVIPVTLANGHSLDVMKVTIHLDDISTGQKVRRQAYYLYWFVGREVNTPSHWTRVFLSSWDRVFHNTNHRWAYVSVFMPVANNQAAAATLEVMKDFIAKSAPEYMFSEMPR